MPNFFKFCNYLILEGIDNNWTAIDGVGQIYKTIFYHKVTEQIY